MLERKKLKDLLKFGLSSLIGLGVAVTINIAEQPQAMAQTDPTPPAQAQQVKPENTVREIRLQSLKAEAFMENIRQGWMESIRVEGSNQPYNFFRFTVDGEDMVILSLKDVITGMTTGDEREVIAKAGLITLEKQLSGSGNLNASQLQVVNRLLQSLGITQAGTNGMFVAKVDSLNKFMIKLLETPTKAPALR